MDLAQLKRQHEGASECEVHLSAYQSYKYTSHSTLSNIKRTDL